MLKDFTLSLELEPTENRVVQTAAIFWSHDVNTAKIYIELLRKGTPIILNKDVTVRVIMLFDDENKSEHIYTAKIEDELKGLVSITLEESMRAYVGQVTCGVYVDYQNEEKTDNGYFTFGMRRSLIDKDMPELQKLYVSDFEKALEKFKEIEKKIEQNDVITQTDLDEKTYNKTYIDEQLSEKVNVKDFESATVDFNLELDKKRDKNGKIKRSDMDTSSDNNRLGLQNLSQEVHNAMAGNAPVNPEIANGSITNEKLADDSVSVEKTDFLITPNNKINFDTIKFKTTINSQGQEVAGSRFCVTDFIKVDKNQTYVTKNVVNANRYDGNKEYINVTNETPFDTYQADYIRLVMLETDYEKAQLNVGSELKPFDNGTSTLTTNVKITNDNIKGREVYSNNITEKGSQVLLIAGVDVVDINTSDKTITIPRDTFFVRGNSNVQLKQEKSISYNSTHTYLFVDFETGAINHYTKLSDINKTSERSAQFMTLTINAVGEVRSVSLNSDYKINGKMASRFEGEQTVPDKKESKIYFTETITEQDYVPIANITGYPSPTNLNTDITQTVIYSKLDKIVSEAPSWATKKVLGKDSSGKHDIIQYEFKPEQVETTRYIKKQPKILFVGCTHGEEKMGGLTLSNLMHDIHENWRKDKTLAFMRHNVHLIMIPILNPSGFDDHQRKNANGVDLNRNFPVRWENGSTDPNSKTYRGPEPLSEVEAKYVDTLLKEHSDATAFFDYHMNGTSGNPGDYEHNFWHYIELFPDSDGFEELNELSKRNVMLMTKRSQEAYNIPEDSGWCGLINYNDKDSTISAYSFSKGIPAFTIECLRKLQHEEMRYSKEAITISTEFIGNHVLNVCRSFCIN
ncbi:DUF2817 domain-containing protein [Vagococcus lutrae]|uniref:DUF2817 domain-containing protein n=1 Tax=Vagococcus lutrae TaxID=81947 RepID=UPI00288CE856|nr:DUF2817 domain-containing protein [Vagococcus lutrae]MDT2824864.1 DUF2817 domain-containing protein [Vagococcus lutrae]